MIKELRIKIDGLTKALKPIQQYDLSTKEYSDVRGDKHVKFELQKLKRMKINLENIIAYIQGNIRYQLYYSNWDFLIKDHIKEQIDWRINNKMDKECYSNGSCKMCGCETTHLQMANKSCDKPCYPVMMNKEDWTNYKDCYNIDYEL